MILACVIIIITGILVCLSVIFKPTIRIGKFQIGTYWLISLFSAIVILCCRILPLDFVWKRMTNPSSVNPFKILILFFSMTFLSIFLDELGFFQYLANKIVKQKHNKQIGLFLKLYIVVSLLTIFTSNDIIILTFTPFICCFAKRAKINPLPFLFGEFFAANTWSMCLIIGNPTNIYLATSANISFFEYVKVMAIPTIFAGILSVLLLLFIFRKSLKEELGIDIPNEIHLNQPLLIISVIHLVLCIIILAISSYLNLEMWYITLGFALSLIVLVCGYHGITRTKPRFLKRSCLRLPFELIPFLLSMFVLVLALEYTEVTIRLADILNTTNPILTIGPSSFIISNLINNIPMSVLYGAILQPENFIAQNYILGIYSAIIGSNIGAYFTPVGALAGLMWMSILKIYDVQISFKKFMKYGLMVAVPTLAIALFGLWIASFIVL